MARGGRVSNPPGRVFNLALRTAQRVIPRWTPVPRLVRRVGYPVRRVANPPYPKNHRLAALAHARLENLAYIAHYTIGDGVFAASAPARMGETFTTFSAS